MTELNIGHRAPDFELSDQAGCAWRLSDALKHGPVVLFFYPKDFTPGCTRQACIFRDTHHSLEKAGATLAGISSDDRPSHERFSAQHNLPFALLSDPGGDVRKRFGVPKTLGLLPGRVTYVIDPSGIIRERFASQIDIAGHAHRALTALQQL